MDCLKFNKETELGNLNRKYLLSTILPFFAILLFTGCAQPVTLYTDADKSAVDSLTAPFSQKTGIPVDIIAFSDVHELADSIAMLSGGEYKAVKHDTLYNYADVVFSTEMTMGELLKTRGMLQQYEPASASGIPDGAKSEGSWYGMGGHTWVLAWNTDSVKVAPQSLLDLANDTYAHGRVALINPNNILYYSCGACSCLGKSQVVPFFQKMISNNTQWDGNPKETAQSLADGTADICLTTLEEALKLQKPGSHIAWAAPDQGAGQMGAYVQYNVVCLMKTSTMPQQAKQLADYLLDPLTEALSVKLGLSNITMRPCGSQAPVVHPLNSNLAAAQASMQSDMATTLLYFTSVNPNYKGK